MDSVAIAGVITGITGLVVAIFTHLKHSECCAGFCKIDTRSPVSRTPSRSVADFKTTGEQPKSTMTSV